MNILVFFSLILLICIRIIGLAVSFDFFYDTKERKFIYLILCWGFWILANIFPILADLTEVNILQEIYLLLNVMCVVLGATFLCWGFISYYMSVSFKVLIILLLIFLIVPLLLYVITDYMIAIMISVLFANILFISAYIIPPIKKKKFSKYMGKTIRWYYATVLTFFIYFPLSVYCFTLGYMYGLYEAEDTFLILLYYAPAISSTILLITLFVHLEYTLSSRHKDDLKDKYSHNLGNIMQAISSAYELYSSEIEKVKGSNELDNLLKSKITEAGKLIKNIREI